MNETISKLVVLLGLCVLNALFVDMTVGQSPANAENKKRVAQAADLPEFTYTMPETVADVVTDDTVFASFASKVRSDVETVFRDHVIDDKATAIRLQTTLLELDLLAGNNAKVLERIELVRQLNLKTVSGQYSMDDIIYLSILDTRQKTGVGSGDEFQKALQVCAFERLHQFNWTENGRQIRRDARMFDMFSEDFVLGAIGNTLEAEARKNDGAIHLENASRAVSLRVLLKLIIPSRAAFGQAYNDFIAAHKAASGTAEIDRSIWTDRNVTLTNDQNLTPVVVAVWDTGVDTRLYPNQLWTNLQETLDGIDNDGNGFVDDIHGVGFLNDVEPTSELLSAIDDSGTKMIADEVLFLRGMADFQNGKATPAAGFAQKRIESMAGPGPEGREALIDSQNIFHGYVHGTHVAGIAIEGNPAARLLTIARIFDLKRSGRLPPTVEWSKEFSKRANEISAYLKTSHVRVVNMSFGDDLDFFDSLLKENGIANDDADRRKIATESFRIYRQALTDLISGCPETLFVCSAGNSDDDANFTGRVPQSIDLPNLIAIGAVDSQGQATGFTSYGKRVRFYANGSNVESFIPGGERIGISGTSQAAPQVTNLAAKLLALDPALSVAETVGLIKDGSSPGSNANMALVNAVHSIQLLPHRHNKGSSSRLPNSPDFE